MNSKYVFHCLVSLYVNFYNHINMNKLLIEKLCRLGGGGGGLGKLNHQTSNDSRSIGACMM